MYPPRAIACYVRLGLVRNCAVATRAERKAKDFLLASGFTNVLNGGGPQVPTLWEQFGRL